MTTDQPTFHRSVSGGPSVKGVHCNRCGEYVGLLQAKSGNWYTCQLVQSMGENSQALRAYPFLPHFKTCGRAQAAEQARRDEREAELRKAITDMEELLERVGTADAHWTSMATESIRTWRELLVTEGYEA